MQIGFSAPHLGKIAKSYRRDFMKLLSHRRVWLMLLGCVILSYGYTIMHPSYSIDDTAIARYLADGEIILQGRLLPYYINKLMQIIRFQPIIVDLLAVLLLCTSALLFFCILQKAAGKRLSIGACAVFVGVVVSYPLIHEIFVFMQMSFSIGVGYLLTTASIAFAYQFLKDRNLVTGLWATCLLVGALLIFESFMALFLTGLFCVLCTECIYRKRSRLHIGAEIFAVILMIASICAATLFLRSIILLIHRPIFADLFAQRIRSSNNSVLWGQDNFFKRVGLLTQNLILSYGVRAVEYFPITILFICMVASLAFAVVLSIRRRKWMIAFFWLAAFLSNFITSLLQGDAQLYRTCQSFAFFCGWTVFLLFHFLLRSRWKPAVKRIGAGLACLFIFHQCQDLNGWFYYDTIRYQYEEQMLYETGFELQRHYAVDQKPVVFTGGIQMPKFITQKKAVPPNGLEDWYSAAIGKKCAAEFVETDLVSVINWAINAFDEPNTELLALFHSLGFDFKQATMAQYEEAIAYSKENKLPDWPQEGSIVDAGAYIIVHY